MSNCAQYIERAKIKLGDRRMSDRELGEVLANRAKRPAGPYSQAAIAQSKTGRCTDPIAVELEKVLAGEVAVGEILLVARAEREKDQVVKERLLTFAKNVLSRASQATAVALAGVAVVLGMMTPLDARARGLAESEGFEPSMQVLAHILP